MHCMVEIGMFLLRSWKPLCEMGRYRERKVVVDMSPKYKNLQLKKKKKKKKTLEKK